MSVTTLEDLLPNGWAGEVFGEFRPGASYSAPMDCVIYLREDVSYRAERIDQFLTILWHPDQEIVVGVKLKGCRFLFGVLRSAVKSVTGNDVPDHAFMPLLGAVELALNMRLGAFVSDQIQHDRARDFANLNEAYALARGMVREVTFDSSPLVASSPARA